MPCSGPRTLPALRSASSARRIGSGLRIDLDHRIQLRPGIVDLRDAIEIGLGQRLGRELARRHPIARVGRAQLDDVDRGLRRGAAGAAAAAASMHAAAITQPAIVN